MQPFSLPQFEDINGVFERLQTAGYHPVRSGTNIRALCPLHERTGEHSRSFTVDPIDTASPTGGLMFHCHGRCDQRAVFDLMRSPGPLPPGSARLKTTANLNGGRGLICSREEMDEDTWRAFMQQEADYNVTEEFYWFRDLEGRGNYVKVSLRIDDKRESEFFAWATQWGEDAKPLSIRRSSLRGVLPLYGTHLLAVADADETVFAVEGEKDVDTLARLGLIAVSTKWFGGHLTDVAGPLADRTIVVIPDNDEAGDKQATRFISVVNRLPGVTLRRLPPFDGPRGYDVTDWIRDGGTAEKLLALAGREETLGAPNDRAETMEGFAEKTKEDTRQARYEALKAQRKEYHRADRDAKRELDAEQSASQAQATTGRQPWEALDLRTLFSEEPLDLDPPAIMQTAQGAHLFYAGTLNTVFGYGGHGKSMLAIMAVADVLLAGQSAAYLTYELPPKVLVSRLHSMFQVPMETIFDRLKIFQGDVGGPQRALAEYGDELGILIVDSTNKALVAHGFKEDSVSGFGQLNNDLLMPFTNAGIAVLTIDHVTQNKETRDRPINSVEKYNAVQGAMYSVDMVVPYSQVESGYAAITLRKDNIGVTGWTKHNVIGYLVCEAHGHGPKVSKFTVDSDRPAADFGRLTEINASRTSEANEARDDTTRMAILEEVRQGKPRQRTPLSKDLAERLNTVTQKTWLNKVNKLVKDGSLVLRGPESLVAVPDEIETVA